MYAKINDKYEITSDSHCFMLNRLSEAGKDAKEPGKKVSTTIGYYSSIDGLFRALPDRVLMKSEATNLQEAIKEVREIGDRAKKMLGALK